jgi:hypothetical protein
MDAAAESNQKIVTTNVRLPADALNLVRRAAVIRAELDGTRVSVSGVLTDLIRANRDALVGGVGQ